jgi:hypothetical protein
MRWEHIFAFAKDGAIVRHESVAGNLTGKTAG